MPGIKVKLEIPNQLPESGVTRVQFKSWREAMITYLKQNDDFLPFFNTLDDTKPCYGSWQTTEVCPDRIENLDAYDMQHTVEQEQAVQLDKRCRDLSAMLSILAHKVDQYNSDDVINCSTGIESICRKGIHFLELSKIKYVNGEVPIKFYKKIYHHFMDK